VSEHCTEILARLPELLEAEEGENTSLELDTIKSHVVTCNDCRAEVAKLRLFRDLGRSAATLMPRPADRVILSAGMLKTRQSFLALVRAESIDQVIPPETQSSTKNSPITLEALTLRLREMQASDRLLLLNEAAAKVVSRVSPNELPLFGLLWQAAASARRHPGPKRGNLAPGIGAIGGGDPVKFAAGSLIEAALWLDAKAASAESVIDLSTTDIPIDYLQLLLEEVRGKL